MMKKLAANILSDAIAARLDWRLAHAPASDTLLVTGLRLGTNEKVRTK